MYLDLEWLDELLEAARTADTWNQEAASADDDETAVQAAENLVDALDWMNVLLAQKPRTYEFIQ